MMLTKTLETTNVLIVLQEIIYFTGGGKKAIPIIISIKFSFIKSSCGSLIICIYFAVCGRKPAFS